MSIIAEFRRACWFTVPPPYRYRRAVGARARANPNFNPNPKRDPKSNQLSVTSHPIRAIDSAKNLALYQTERVKLVPVATSDIG